MSKIKSKYVEMISLQLTSSLSADGQWSGITEVGTLGETIAFGDNCYFDVSTSKWKKVLANAVATSGGVQLGMCLAGGSANAASEFLLMGYIRADSKFPTLTIGAPVYPSATTAGLIVAGSSSATTGQPTATDSVIRIIGYGKAAKVLYFNPENHFITHV